jgi:hypothetical protein
MAVTIFQLKLKTLSDFCKESNETPTTELLIMSPSLYVKLVFLCIQQRLLDRRILMVSREKIILNCEFGRVLKETNMT